MTERLSCLKKRDLLHNEQVSTADLLRFAHAFLEDGRPVDALDFFEKAGDREGIHRIRRWSIEQGDPFLLRQTGKLLKEPIPAEEWRQVGQKALEEGRYAQALNAFRSAGDEDKIQEILTLMSQNPHVQPA